jgi:hypothetical protein
MNSDGKIYVVIAVMSLLFIGIFAIVLLMDRKLTKLEKQIKSNERK